MIIQKKYDVKFMERKSNEPRLTQKQICIHLGYSNGTTKRYRDDITMDSLYSRNKYKKYFENTIPNTYNK